MHIIKAADVPDAAAQEGADGFLLKISVSEAIMLAVLTGSVTGGLHDGLARKVCTEMWSKLHPKVDYFNIVHGPMINSGMIGMHASAHLTLGKAVEAYYEGN